MNNADAKIQKKSHTENKKLDFILLHQEYMQCSEQNKRGQNQEPLMKERYERLELLSYPPFFVILNRKRVYFKRILRILISPLVNVSRTILKPFDNHPVFCPSILKIWETTT